MENSNSEEKTLEILLSSPFVWKSSKCCNFLEKVHNLMNKDLQELETDNLPDFPPEWRLWPSGSSWKDVFQDECTSILSACLNPKISLKASINGVKSNKFEDEKISITKLLAIIRNALEHKVEYREEDTKKLNWFRKRDFEDKWDFDTSLFLNYWNQRFPQLLPYLWWRYWTLKDAGTLEDSETGGFYPSNLKSFHLKQLFNFSQNISHALETHLGQGVSEKLVDNLVLTELKSCIIQRLVGRSSYAEIEITEKNVSCRWYKNLETGFEMTDERVTSLNWGEGIDNITLFIGKRLSDIDMATLSKKCFGSEGNNCKVVIFVNVSSFYPAYEKIGMLNIANIFDCLRTDGSMKIPVAQEDLKKITRFTTHNENILLVDDFPHLAESFGKKLLASYVKSILNKTTKNHVVVFLEKHKFVQLEENSLLKCLLENHSLTLQVFMKYLKSDELANNTDILRLLEEKNDAKFLIFIDNSEKSLECDQLKAIIPANQLPEYLAKHVLENSFKHSFQSVNLNEGKLESDILQYLIKIFYYKTIEQKYHASYLTALENEYLPSFFIPRSLSGELVFNVNTLKPVKFQEDCEIVPAKYCHHLSYTDAELEEISRQSNLLKQTLTELVVSDLNLDREKEYSLIDLYNQMIDRKLEIYLREKIGVTRKNFTKSSMFNTLRVQFDLSHVYYSLKLIVSDNIAEQLRDFLILTPSSNEELDESILEYDIVKTIKPLKFVHRTYAEYFIARFAHRVITRHYLHLSETDNVFQQLFNNEMLATYRMSEYDKDGECFRCFKYLGICYFYNELWNNEVLQTCPDKHSLFNQGIRDLSQKNLWNCDLSKIAPFLSAAIRLGFPAFLDVMLRSSKLTTKIIHNSLHAQNFEFLEYVIENNLGLFGSENWDRLIINNNKLGQVDSLNTILECKRTKLREFFSYLLEKKRKNMDFKHNSKNGQRKKSKCSR